MCLADGLPELDDTLPERLPARRARRRIQPLTWIFAVALLPVLLYDVWQTVQDVKQHHVARAHDAAMNLAARPGARPGRLELPQG
jgi:hypothetical protein